MKNEEIILSENFTNNENIDLNNSSQMPDIDELQAIIMKQMAEDEENSPDYLENFESTENYAEESEKETTNFSIDDEYYDIAPREKKYVVAISPKNVPYFEELSPEKRTCIINNLIEEYQEKQRLNPEIERSKRFFKHSLVVVGTILIGLPLFFFVVNASIEATANSYRAVQNNFEKLYQQKGGVKRKDLTKMQNLQY